MVVELIVVGSEYLRGDFCEAVAGWISEQCSFIGFEQTIRTMVADDCNAIEIALDRSILYGDLVIVAGGTYLSKDCFVEKLLAEKYAMNTSKKLLNDRGFVAQKENKAVLVLSGTTEEIRATFEEEVVPYLKGYQKKVFFSKTAKLCGVGRDEVEQKVRQLQKEYPDLILQIYEKCDGIHIRVICTEKGIEEAKELVKPVIKALKNHFEKKVYSTEEAESFEASVVRLLRKKEMTICTAESCTGGLLAAKLVNVSGASEVFGQGYITYANRAKKKLLEVDKNTLKKHGAVSKQTAREMALGASLTSGADIGVSITGVAGPLPDEDKEVGLVYIGCCHKDTVHVEEHHFTGNRQMIREKAVQKALELVRKVILD